MKLKGFIFIIILTLISSLAIAQQPMITNIKFKGNKMYSQSRLKRLMGSQESNIFKTHRLYSDLLLADLKAIVDFYHLHGFEDAKIENLSLNWKSDSSQVDVIINIDEGEPTLIEKIDIYGVESDVKEKLLNLLKISPGDRLDYDLIAQGEKRILQHFGNLGYLSAKTNREIETEDNRAEIVFFISEGIRAYFNNIIIRSGRYVEDWVIEREFDFKKGGLITLNKIEKAQKNLQRMGLFRNIIIETERFEDDSLRNLIVSLSEKPAGEFGLGGGYGSYEGPRLVMSFEHLNLFRRRTSLGLEGKISPRMRMIEARGYEPYFLKSRLFFHSGIKWSVEKEASFDVERASVRFRWGRYFREYFQLQWGYSFNHYMLYNTAPGIVIPDSAGNISRIEIEFSVDKRDDRFKASKGFLFDEQLHLSESKLFGDAGFIKYMADFRIFYKPFPWLALAAQSKLGIIENFEKEPAPLSEKFMLGGSEDIRGYKWHSLGPLNEQGLVIGGNFTAVERFEFRLHIYRWFGTDIFIDCGGLYEDIESSEWRGLRTGAGQGLRMDYSVWSATIQYAWRIHQGVKPGAYYFNVGYSF